MIRYEYTGEGVGGFARYGDSREPRQMVDLYRSMLRIRRIEEEIERRYHQDQMKTPIHLVIGQEATAVGCCAALTRSDLVYSSHRTHGAYLAKGGDLKAMLCEMHCRVNGCAGSRGGSMHLIDKGVGMAGTSAIVGGAVPIAVGAALAAQMKGEDRVVVVFLGDATTEEGVCSESLNFAALKQVPVDLLLREQFLLGAIAAGDAPAAARVSFTSGRPRTRCRRPRSMAPTCWQSKTPSGPQWTGRVPARGPSFIEARVYRFRAHGGSGDDTRTGYRHEAEPAAWLPFDPIAMFGEYLASRNALNEADVAGMEDEIQREIAEAFDFALASPNPTEADLYKHVYAD